ncbi:hypothetical protein GPALN_010692 [Globodera pallida]|nr:hypothetical protein GPALN_010692 [Globodera pallida]
MSYPPISQVMAQKNCLDVLDQLGTYLKTKNADGIKHIGGILSELGLDHITPAFIKCVEQKSICQNCGKQVVNPDELCCCPNSAERCHCTGCCDKGKLVSGGWSMLNNASSVHHQQEPVFPKFGEVLKMTKCEGLAKSMEQLTVNAAAHGGLSEGNDLLASINKELADVGLNNMMDAFNRALDSKLVCKKCKKQLELNDICYCDDAKTKCHCNSRTCCTVTLKEHGKAT